MGRELKNEFSWSPSRDRLFNTCRRAYYYSYYGAWGGWDAAAPERTRLTYVLKNMTTLPMWSGSIVHDVIRQALLNRRDNGVIWNVTALQEEARMQLRRGWVESVRGDWRSNPKRAVNLFEHYYGDGSNTLPREQTDAVKQRIYDALENFANSETAAEALSLPPERWKSIEVLDSFYPVTLSGEVGVAMPVKVWCAIDFAYCAADGITHIVDWKTGAEHREELNRQLNCYALYAGERWNLTLEQVAMEGVFLNDGGIRKQVFPSPAGMESTVKYIANSSRTMLSLLRDPVANTAAEEDFECSGVRTGACRNCPFRCLCEAVSN